MREVVSRAEPGVCAPISPDGGREIERWSRVVAPRHQRALAAVAAAIVVGSIVLTPLFGGSQWVAGAFALLPSGIVGWGLGRREGLRWMLFLAPLLLLGGRATSLLATGEAMAYAVQLGGLGMLVAATAVVGWARDATDGQRRALSVLAEEAIQRGLMLQMEQAIAECATALLRKEPEEAVDEALGALQRGTGARAAYIIEFGEDIDDLRRFRMRDEDGLGHRSEPRPWVAYPSLVSRLHAGEPIVLTPEDGIPELAHPIRGEQRIEGLVGLVGAADRVWTPTERETLRAVAELVGAAWARRRTEERMARLLASKDRFIASVSHELRTPLAVVVGLSSDLRDHGDEFDGDERATLLDLVAQQSQELGDMIEDLLVSARAEEAQLAVVLEDVDLVDLIPRLMGGFQPDIAAKVTCGESRPPVVVADPLRLRQILRNLIVNAHRHGGPKIRLDTIVAGDRAVLHVSDDGPGIPEDLREAVFEPYRSMADSRGRTSSIGLGLTVSRDLARLMGGDLRYRELDGRSVFEVDLRMAKWQPPGVGTSDGWCTAG